VIPGAKKGTRLSESSSVFPYYTCSPTATTSFCLVLTLSTENHHRDKQSLKLLLTIPVPGSGFKAKVCATVTQRLCYKLTQTWVFGYFSFGIYLDRPYVGYCFTRSISLRKQASSASSYVGKIPIDTVLPRLQ
jgi:hypothetical protein